MPPHSTETRAGSILERRLGALQLAALLGNVSEACRRLGIDRGSYYNWQRRFRAGGVEALRPASHGASAGRSKAAASAGAIRRTALAHPGWGCARLAAALAAEGIQLSPPTVQSSLDRMGMSRRRDRALCLERLVEEQHVGLSAEQIALVERFEPAFRDRATSAHGPGDRLLQAAFYVARVEGRRAYVHCLLDVRSSFAVARLAGGRGRAASAASLLSDSVRALRGRGLVTREVFTPDAPPFCGGPRHPYRRALRRGHVGQVVTPALRGQVERFRRHLLAELLRGDGRLHLDDTWEALNRRVAACLEAYNSSPLAGPPNHGRPPVSLWAAAVERTA